MIGEQVTHPQYGPGQIVAIYRNGAEWLVRFDSGLRFRRPRHEFNGQAEPVLRDIPTIYAAPAPMPQTQFEARQLIEALRVGIAPAQHVRDLTIGLAEERASLVAGLNEAHRQGGAVRSIVGEYGYGKSHIVELTTQEALDRNFLVATASLDLQEMPPHNAFKIYSGLVRYLRYPKNDERGLSPLLEAVEELPRARELLEEVAPVEKDPLVTAVSCLPLVSSTRQRQSWHNWLMGGRRTSLMYRNMPYGLKIPSIYTQGNNARQLAYLLSGLSVLARLANYSGLCLLIDEAESYSLLKPAQRAKADQFFQAVIYAALRENQYRITADSLPQHRWKEYPLAYGRNQSLFFLFTMTHSDNRMPLEQWLDPANILELNPHHTAQEIGQFLQQVSGYHAQAYAYEPDERYGQIRRGAAEHLALGMKNGRLSIRSTVRLTIELFDLLYTYPNYAAAALLDELRHQLRE